MSRKKSKKYKTLAPESSEFFQLEDDAFEMFKAHVESNTPPKKDSNSKRQEPLKGPPRASKPAEKHDTHRLNKKLDCEIQNQKSKSLFDLEDNASDLFKSHVDTETPAPKDEEPATSKQRKAKQKRRRSVDQELTIDLHGLTTKESERVIDETVLGLLAGVHSRVSLKIITGKGLHSPDGKAVLSGHVHRYIRQRYAAYITKIDDAPSEVTLRGLPIRGHFCVILKF